MIARRVSEKEIYVEEGTPYPDMIWTRCKLVKEATCCMTQIEMRWGHQAYRPLGPTGAGGGARWHRIDAQWLDAHCE
jgi:hypothetical protein